MGDAGAADGNGYISKLSLKGEILDKEWVTGLNAPKGLALHNGKLYVSDIDKLVVIRYRDRRDRGQPRGIGGDLPQRRERT